MGVLHWLELEERVGTLWHRLVGNPASYPRHPQAAVALGGMRARLAVFFHALGGDAGVEIAAATARTSRHRLSVRQILAMDDERLVQATLDEASLSLPPVIDLFPDSRLNADLYLWLAAFFTCLSAPAAIPTNPVAADLDRIARAEAATRQVLARYPGLRGRYDALVDAFLPLRPARPSGGVEARVEAAVRAALRLSPQPQPPQPQPPQPQSPQTAAPADYRPFLPVPLWGEVTARPVADTADGDVGQSRPRGSEEDEEVRRKRATRRRQDQAERKDSLILNRFEKILSFADMVNVNRASDDTDEDEAKKAADDMEEMVLAPHGRKAATKLKFDLDLPPGATDPARLSGNLLYPEWDCRAKAYRPDYCSVLTATAAEDGEDWQPDDATRRRIRRVRRQFEALRSRPLILRGLADGAELDMEAVVRARCDLRASGTGNDRLWLQRRAQDRDLAVTVLVDASLSTDAWIDNRRVLDVEKEALSVLAAGLAAGGDDFSILSFTSRKRSWVRVETVKGFDETFGPSVQRRIGALKPGYYTRIGAAIRHAARELTLRPNRHRLLLVLTDGKPNDVDHYEGRYGIEDTRRAILDARAGGIAVFGITIDQKAQAYFPHLFGRGGFAIVHHLAQLSAALPRLYAHVAGAAR